MDVLNYLVDEGEEITRRTFLAHTEVTPEEFPARDWHIRYFKRGPIYWAVHSAIEYVFADKEDIENLAQQLDEQE